MAECPRQPPFIEIEGVWGGSGAAIRRAMRILAALAALPLLTTFAPPSLYSGPVYPDRATIAFQAVPLDEDDPARRRLGSLSYLGGWAISSNDPRFGGISAIHIEDGMVLAVSDAGSLIRFSLPGAGPASIDVRPLPDGPGSAGSKLDRDAEAMTVHEGRAWIGFEQRNAVWRYRLGDWRSDVATRPPAMRRWPSNGGSEAMVRLPDGRFLVFSEDRLRRDGTSEVLLFAGDPALAETPSTSLGYRPPKGYRITDAALLPDGRLLFLNRRFRILEGVSAKLTVGPFPPASGDEPLGGAEIAHFEEPVTVDNMEAMDVTREGGKTIVWVTSDDNLNALQRTLLLKFALDAK